MRALDHVATVTPEREIRIIDAKIRYLEDANAQGSRRREWNTAEIRNLRELRAGWVNERLTVLRERRDHAMKIHFLHADLCNEAYRRVLLIEEEIAEVETRSRRTER